MEACSGSQYRARRLRELGHKASLLPAKMVRPFVVDDKKDSHDARAIWTAVQQPDLKTVALKSEEQQAALVLHQMRGQLVKFRTAQSTACAVFWPNTEKSCREAGWDILFDSGHPLDMIVTEERILTRL